LFSSLFVLLMQPVAAGEPAAVPPAPVPAEALAQPAAPAALLLPKTTPLIIAIDKELGSKISVTGETFPIRLVEAVSVDGVEVLPAGITGQGEVVHAKKAGLAGAAGELVLAARYLELNGRRIELRSFRFMEASELAQVKGRDNVSEVNATMAVLSPLAIFIGGGNTNVAPGTFANAKTRNDELFERPAAPEAAVAPGTFANAKTRNDELFERPAAPEAAEQKVENREDNP
jgi:hypothetical protein